MGSSEGYQLKDSPCREIDQVCVMYDALPGQGVVQLHVEVQAEAGAGVEAAVLGGVAVQPLLLPPRQPILAVQP